MSVCFELKWGRLLLKLVMQKIWLVLRELNKKNMDVTEWKSSVSLKFLVSEYAKCWGQCLATQQQQWTSPWSHPHMLPWKIHTHICIGAINIFFKYQSWWIWLQTLAQCYVCLCLHAQAWPCTHIHKHTSMMVWYSGGLCLRLLQGTIWLSRESVWAHISWQLCFFIQWVTHILVYCYHTLGCLEFNPIII